MNKKVYISGAITGTDDYMERFKRAEEKLTRAGYSVINPAKVNAQLPAETTYNEYMLMSFCMLDMCDCIYMLDGWQKSNGANKELKRAKDLNLDILYQPTDWAVRLRTEVYQQPLAVWQEQMLRMFMRRSRE